jgi:hypothetical protein
VAECIRDALDGSHRIVADAILGMGVFSGAHYRHRIDPDVRRAAV